jgi:hypothetical protein
MRQHARLWSERAYLDVVLRELPGFFGTDDPTTGRKMKLPGKAARVRNDVFMYAHIMLVPKMIGQKRHRANFWANADGGLAAAFRALSVDMVKDGRANIVEVIFTKGQTNDGRSTLARMGTDEYHDLSRRYAAETEKFGEFHPDLTRRQTLVAHQLRLRLEDVPADDRGRVMASPGDLRGLDPPGQRLVQFHAQAGDRLRERSPDCIEPAPDLPRLRVLRSGDGADAHHDAALLP